MLFLTLNCVFPVIIWAVVSSGVASEPLNSDSQSPALYCQEYVLLGCFFLLIFRKTIQMCYFFVPEYMYAPHD